MKNIRPAHRLFSPTTGREFFPQISGIVAGATPALVAGLTAYDPGVSRCVGTIAGAWITAKGDKIDLVVLVETGDPDGCEWMEWVAVNSSAAEARGQKVIDQMAAYAANQPRRDAEYAARVATAQEKPKASTPDTGASYREQGDPRHPDKYDSLKAAREWAEDAYRSGDSWSDD